MYIIVSFFRQYFIIKPRQILELWEKIQVLT